MSKKKSRPASAFAPHARAIRQMVKSGLSESKAFTAVAAIVAQTSPVPVLVVPRRAMRPTLTATPYHVRP